MDLSLMINEVPISAGQEIDPDALLEADFHKASPLSRLFHRVPLGLDLFHAENCKMEGFPGNFSIYPCTDSYLNEDRQWSTKVDIYIEDRKPRKMMFQVIKGHYAASNFMDRFREACNDSFGEPLERDRFATVWRNGSATVTAVLHADRINADFLIEWDPD